MMLGGAIAIGFAPIGLRLSDFGPQATAFWRFLFALPMLGAIAVITEGGLGRPSPYAMLAGLFFGLDIALWHAALTQTSVANATFLVNIGNASVGLIAWIALRERPGRLWIPAMTVALTGALLLSRGSTGDDSGELGGDVLALLAAAMVALYLFFALLARRRQQPMQVLFWSTAVTLGVSLSASLVSGEQVAPPSFAWFAWPAALAIVAHVGGQGLIVAGVGRTAPAFAGLILLIQPVTAALIAWRLFGEALAPLQLLGATLILGGVWAAGRR
ncbi:MAG: DMT family transporter [Hyphomonadaceae bacterium]